MVRATLGTWASSLVTVHLPRPSAEIPPSPMTQERTSALHSESATVGPDQPPAQRHRAVPSFRDWSGLPSNCAVLQSWRERASEIDRSRARERARSSTSWPENGGGVKLNLSSFWAGRSLITRRRIIQRLLHGRWPSSTTGDTDCPVKNGP